MREGTEGQGEYLKRLEMRCFGVIPSQVKTIYYSPTGTTRTIVRSIAEGTGLEGASVDLTLPSLPGEDALELGEELLVVGAPVYGGRLPEMAVHRLSALRGDNTPSVLAVVYGNREYEDALKELELLVSQRGFQPVAAGAFIGQHSFSSASYPIAPGRPDQSDLEKAREMGARTLRKLSGISSPGDLPRPKIPGSIPLKERSQRETSPPIVDEISCIQCYACVSVCPTGASGEAVGRPAPGRCTLCTACVRICPERARHFSGRMADQLQKAAQWLSSNYGIRREPELFF